jgi:hypothetical protein
MGSRSTQDFALLLKQLDAFLRLAQLGRVSLSHTGFEPSSTSAILSHRCRHDSEIPKSFAIRLIGASPFRATATTSRRNSWEMLSEC